MSDLIDRQALLKQIDIDSDGEPGYYGDTWKFIDTIKNMPNVHDLPKDADTISRQAAIETVMECYDNDELFEVYEDKLRELPPAQPEPKRGKWIKISPANIYECSECGKSVMTIDICAYDFCHGCGADMREEKEK